MKKKLVLVGLLSFTALFGCVQVSQDVQAGIENEFELVSEESITIGDLFQIKHKDTGCYYLMSKRMNSGGLTQMMIEKDGVTIPYCEK